MIPKNAGKFAAAVLGFNLLTILWGAVVRATGSGAGCNDHWPSCDGSIIPVNLVGAKAIEFTHRVTSGLAVIGIFALAFYFYRTLEKGHRLRIASRFAVAFGIIECLVGAALVRFKLVAADTSAPRAIVMSLHHVNTAILVTCLTLMAYWAFGGAEVRLKRQGTIGWIFGLCGAGLVLVIVSGALTALGDTLFPMHNSIDTIKSALAPAAHFLMRLRVAHPVISTSAVILIVLAMPYVGHLRPQPNIQKHTRWLVMLASAQLVCGFLNVMLKAPLWMQLLHLLVSNGLWVLFVITAAESLSVHFQAEEVEQEAVPQQTVREKVNSYVALTKPRVISLLLFTTFTAMLIAQRGWPNGWLVLAVMIGGYCAAGSANAINMVIDRDIDGTMERTKKRPTVTHVISSGNAMLFAFTLEAISFTLLSFAANVLTACLALAGLLFYVFIYTLLLKRRTWQNIVIGGAAGAFPPLVGYAAITNNLSPLAWFLFLLIFFWTPVHFWALALIIQDDYRDAGVPMLPVVRGDRATVIQITAYAVLTALLCLLPLFQGELGLVYFISSLVLNGLLVLRSVQLMKSPDRPHARKLFKFSMAYLALVFVAIAADRISSSPHVQLRSASAVQAEQRFELTMAGVGPLTEIREENGSTV